MLTSKIKPKVQHSVTFQIIQPRTAVEVHVSSSAFDSSDDVGCSNRLQRTAGRCFASYRDRSTADQRHGQLLYLINVGSLEPVRSTVTFSPHTNVIAVSITLYVDERWTLTEISISQSFRQNVFRTHKQLTVTRKISLIQWGLLIGFLYLSHGHLRLVFTSSLIFLHLFCFVFPFPLFWRETIFLTIRNSYHNFYCLA